MNIFLYIKVFFTMYAIYRVYKIIVISIVDFFLL